MGTHRSKSTQVTIVITLRHITSLIARIILGKILGLKLRVLPETIEKSPCFRTVEISVASRQVERDEQLNGKRQQTAEFFLW